MSKSKTRKFGTVCIVNTDKIWQNPSSVHNSKTSQSKSNLIRLETGGWDVIFTGIEELKKQRMGMPTPGHYMLERMQVADIRHKKEK